MPSGQRAGGAIPRPCRQRRMNMGGKGSEQDPALGTSAVLRAGRFQVGERLGQGAAGIVYRAFDAELGIDVALKMLPTSGPEEVFHLKREFRAIAGISHRHLVELYDLFVDAPACFFTMELV